MEGHARPQTLLLACIPRAIYSILGIWLDQHHEDFFQPPEFPCLRLLLAYIQLNFRGSSLEHQVQLLLSALTDLESPEAETEGEDNYGGNVACECVGQCRATHGAISEAGLGQNTESAHTTVPRDCVRDPFSGWVLEL